MLEDVVPVWSRRCPGRLLRVMNTHTKQARTPTPRSHTLGYSLFIMCVKEGKGGRWSRMTMRRRQEGQVALVVNLDCFLQVGVATSLWSFVEMIQP